MKKKMLIIYAQDLVLIKKILKIVWKIGVKKFLPNIIGYTTVVQRD